VRSSSRSNSSEDRLGNRAFGVCAWLERKKTTVLVTSIISLVLLFILHLSAVTMQISSESILQNFVTLITVILLLLIAISVLCKGVIPIVICSLGLTLVYAGILYPSYFMETVGELYYKSSHGFMSERSVLNAAHGYFLLGLFMVVMSMIVGYKPALLYIRNRPEPLDDIWHKYPIWYDNVKVVGSHDEPSVSVKSLMTPEERYLLWRYEFVLTSIYGMPHLVKPNGYVPASSKILRDRENQSMIGKSRYTGYFG
jgi:hypothetical protein